MRSHGDPRRPVRFGLRAAAKAGAAAGLLAAFLVPAQAQFWGDWGRPQPRYQQQYNPFGDWFRNNGRPPARREREAPADNSRAPVTRKAEKEEAQVTTKILVMGDGMADWLAYGLEDAFSEQPEIGIARRNRTSSGLIRYDGKIEWPQVAKDAITQEKPKFIVMMVGVNDRESIREQAPAPASRANTKRNAAQPAPAPKQEALDPEAAARQSADEQNAAIEAKAEEAAAAKEEQQQAQEHKARPVNGTFEFHSDEWEAAYIKRIDATIAALKSAGVPVFWVGLPSQRNTKVSSDTAYLNDIYRQRAEKAGIVFVDIWDGFVDEGGRYSVQGPDYEGQIRRLRSGDGVYFTKAGARKLAHYVEREIQRSMGNRVTPVALPVEPAIPAPNSAKGGTAARPLAGPVVPLTVSTGGGNELLGGGTARVQQRPPAPDPTASRVLTKGEPIQGASGRADDFTWPRGSDATVTTPEPTPASVTPAVTPTRAQQGKQQQQPQQQTRRAGNSTAQNTGSDADPADAPPPPARKKAARRSGPRPPLAINPSTWFR